MRIPGAWWSGDEPKEEEIAEVDEGINKVDEGTEEEPAVDTAGGSSNGESETLKPNRGVTGVEVDAMLDDAFNSDQDSGNCSVSEEDEAEEDKDGQEEDEETAEAMSPGLDRELRSKTPNVKLRQKIGELEEKNKKLEAELKECKRQTANKAKAEKKQQEKKQRKLRDSVKTLYKEGLEERAPERALVEQLRARIEALQQKALEGIQTAQDPAKAEDRFKRLGVDEADIEVASRRVETLRSEYEIKLESLRPFNELIEGWRKLDVTDRPTQRKLCVEWRKAQQKRAQQLLDNKGLVIDVAVVKSLSDEEARGLLEHAEQDARLQGYSQCAIDLARMDVMIRNSGAKPENEKESWAYLTDRTHENNPVALMGKAAALSTRAALIKEYSRAEWNDQPFRREWHKVEDPSGKYHGPFGAVRQGRQQGMNAFFERREFDVKKREMIRKDMEKRDFEEFQRQQRK